MSFAVPAAPKAANDDADEIVVTGKKKAAATNFFGNAIETVLRGAGVGRSMKSPGAGSILDASGKSIGTFAAPAAPVKGVGISDDAAAKIGKFSGRAIEGAATGAFANSIFEPLAKGLGLKTSKMGAQLGGAIGSAIPIPGAAEVGAILGSITGGRLKKTKSGSVTLTSATSDLTAAGNNGAAKKAATSIGGSIQSALQSVAEQLNGQLGAFNVTVGQRGGDYRVTTGTSLKTKKGAVNFDEDGDAAQAYALQLAISQGAIKGLSAALQQAIKSSPDINRGLSEALKVQEIEGLLADVGSAMANTFKSFEKTAAERVRVAQTYGLDLVRLEGVNAKQRADIFESVVSQRTSSLKALLDDLSYGDLAEGSPVDKRNKLREEVESARVSAEAGEDGAADRLASLSRELLASTKEAFGTGGELAADIASTETSIARVVQLENDRAKAAQDEARGLRTAAEKGNTIADQAVKLADENAYQNAQVIAKLDGILTAVSGGSGRTVVVPDYASAIRKAVR